MFKLRSAIAVSKNVVGLIVVGGLCTTTNAQHPSAGDVVVRGPEPERPLGLLDVAGTVRGAQ